MLADFAALYTRSVASKEIMRALRALRDHREEPEDRREIDELLARCEGGLEGDELVAAFARLRALDVDELVLMLREGGGLERLRRDHTN